MSVDGSRDGRWSEVARTVSTSLNARRGTTFPAVRQDLATPGSAVPGRPVLGRRVALSTEIGADAYGTLIRNHVAPHGLEAAEAGGAMVFDQSTTTVADELDPSIYSFDLAPVLSGAPLFHVHTDSIPSLPGPVADGVETALCAARRRASLSFDANLRSAVRREGGGVRERVERVVAISDVVKTAEEDLRLLFPGRDPVDVAREWSGIGPSVVIVTLKSQALIGVAKSGAVLVPGGPAAVADAAGAWARFTATVLQGLREAELLGADRRGALRDIETSTLWNVLEGAALAAAHGIARTSAAAPARTLPAALEGPSARQNGIRVVPGQRQPTFPSQKQR
nr:PfkB family carbohydrate kinase [Cellulomonas sp. URHD0024]